MLFFTWEEGKILSYINHGKTNHTQIKNGYLQGGEKGVRGQKGWTLTYKTSTVSTLELWFT